MAGGGKIFSSFSPRLPPTSPYLDASPYGRPTSGATSVASGVYRYPTGAPPPTNPTPSSIPPTSNASSPYSVRSLAAGGSAAAAGESQASMALAYNQLMSSMAAHFHQQQHLQQQQQHSLAGKLGPVSSGASSAPSPGVLENLEKLAALAAGASSSSARNDMKSSVAGNWINSVIDELLFLFLSQMLCACYI